MLSVIAIALSVLRWVPLARPLFGWLPPRFQWLPSAIVAAASFIVGRMGWEESALAGVIGPETLALIDAGLGAAVGFALAMQAGLKPSDPDEAPPTLRNDAGIKTIALLFFGILSMGCSASFEESRLVSPQVGATADRQRCEELDDRRTLWGGIAKGSAIVAGSAGLAAVPVTSHKAEVGLAAGSVAAAALGAAAVYVSESAGDRWVEECR